MEFVAGVYGVALVILGGSTIVWRGQLKKMQQRLQEEKQSGNQE
uniref:Heme exporter protein D n=1 Tax=Magnetococcus massalia (strain MO-1) TaxID=451514 RepID=A0A1S7LN85_MAGMO|nr:Protein of unknown function [Candidatus Magnetococcus massalia]